MIQFKFILTTGLGVLSLIATYTLWPRTETLAGTSSRSLGAASSEDDVRVLFSAPGVTEPGSGIVRLSSELAGTIHAIHVRAGDPVRKGQLLVEFNNETQQAQVDQAKSIFVSTQADLTRLRNGRRLEERAIARAEFDEVAAMLRMATFEWEHVKRIAEAKGASERETESARIARVLAEARTEAARKRWELAEAAPRQEDVDKAEAAVHGAAARLAIAEHAYRKTRILSPIDGSVVYCYYKPGEVVRPDSLEPILTVGDCRQMRIRADVDEIDVGRVSIGQGVFATTPAFADKRFAGRVIHIESTLGLKNFRTHRPTERIDTKILEVVIAIENADDLPVELPMVVWFLASDNRRM